MTNTFYEVWVFTNPKSQGQEGTTLGFKRATEEQTICQNLAGQRGQTKVSRARPGLDGYMEVDSRMLARADRRA